MAEILQFGVERYGRKPLFPLKRLGFSVPDLDLAGENEVRPLNLCLLVWTFISTLRTTGWGGGLIRLS